jgi:hypothetical protein
MNDTIIRKIINHTCIDTFNATKYLSECLSDNENIQISIIECIKERLTNDEFFIDETPQAKKLRLQEVI